MKPYKPNSREGYSEKEYREMRDKIIDEEEKGDPYRGILTE